MGIGTRNIYCGGGEEKPADLQVRRKGVKKNPPDCPNTVPAEAKLDLCSSMLESTEL